MEYAKSNHNEALKDQHDNYRAALNCQYQNVKKQKLGRIYELESLAKPMEGERPFQFPYFIM